MSLIASTAIVPADCHLGESVSIGEGCRVGVGVTIGSRTRLEDGVRIDEGVTIGEDNVIGHGTIIKSGSHIGRHNTLGEYSVVGGAPLIAGRVEPGKLEIGDRNVIREFATIQVGTGADGLTRIGGDNFIMPNVQIGHDSIIGSRVTLTNRTALCGHVTIDDRAVLGVAVVVHQHCRIGTLAMVGATAYVSRDVAPFVLVDGRTGGVVGLNRVGLRRRDTERDTMSRLKQAYTLIFRSGLSRREILAELEGIDCAAVRAMLVFIRESQRSLATERRAGDSANSSAPSNTEERPGTLPFPRQQAA